MSGVFLLLPYTPAEAQTTSTVSDRCPPGTIRSEVFSTGVTGCYDENDLATLLSPFQENIDGFNNFLGNKVSETTTDILNTFLKWLALLFMSLASWVLGMAGFIFDYFVQWTVVGFRETLENTQILESIGYIWALMRDIGNILIIGMFVFIAISTILSIEAYGYKKLIAKVLIVAVLINFSMFFATFTIDISNFISRQIYTEMQKVNTSEVTSGGVETSSEYLGIASAFTTKLGITTLFGSPEEEEVKSRLDTLSDPLSIFLYGLGATIFLLALAAALLYGTFLLATRAIVLIVVILTSSLAFSSMLIPGKMGENIWGKWKEGLINGAVFAPIMMLGLYISYYVVARTNGLAQGSSLGSFLISPDGSVAATSEVSSGAGPTALLLFIVTIGLLFATMRVASSFAGKIAGFNFAAAIPALGLSALGGGVGVIGRNTAGRFAVSRANRVRERAEEEYRKTGTVSDRTMQSIRRWDNIGKQSFDLRNTKAVQNLTKKTALGKVASATPFIGKALSKQLTEGVNKGRSGLVDDAKKKEVENISEKVKIGSKVEAKEREAVLKAEKDSLTSHKDTLEKEVARKASLNTDLEKIRAIGDGAKTEEDLNEAVRQEAYIQSQIAESEKAAETAQSSIDKANQRVDKAEKDKKDTNAISDSAINKIAGNTQGISTFNKARRSWYGISNEDDALAKAVRKNTKNKENKEKLKDFAKVLKEETDDNKDSAEKADTDKEKKENK